MSTPVNTSSTDSQMHNNIMAAGSKDRPPMLGPGRYSQWRSRFLPRKLPAVQQYTAIETVLNMTLENKEHFQSEKDAIFLLLTGIGDEIYSIKYRPSILGIWECLLLRDGESMESNTHEFSKLMNEFNKDNLQVTTNPSEMFNFSTSKPEWSRLFNILKQFQKEVNDIRAEIKATVPIPLAMSCGISPYSDTYIQAPKPKNQMQHHLLQDKVQLQDTRAKRTPKPITPQSESVSEEDMILTSSRDREMQKNLAP
ncbi:hypothetical protein Tco_0111873 [Tanacetum coccineum]